LTGAERRCQTTQDSLKCPLKAVARVRIPSRLLRYTRAYLYDDGEALLECSSEAASWLRRHGEEQAAVHAEITGVASALMSTGRFQELDADRMARQPCSR
jgi:hypothetical protein